MKRGIIVTLLVFAFCISDSEAKKIKHSFRIDKSSEKVSSKKENRSGKEIFLPGSLEIENDTSISPITSELGKVRFAGYEKEPNANKESFILINPTNKTITGFRVKIDYLDMKERMLHSRTIDEKCEVPGEESRKFDIQSWDPQRTYYYYLGNEPKKVATPYKVKFTPISFRIE